MPGICRNLALLPDLPSTSYTRSISWRRDEGKAQIFSTSFHLLFFCRMRSVRGKLWHRGHQDTRTLALLLAGLWLSLAVQVALGAKKKKQNSIFFALLCPCLWCTKVPAAPCSGTVLAAAHRSRCTGHIPALLRGFFSLLQTL